MNDVRMTQAPGLPPPEREFFGWLGEAGPGDRRVYYRGSLANDRSSTSSRLLPADRARLGHIASSVLAAAEAGLVDLVQHRHGPFDYEYSVIVRFRPRTEHSVLLDVLSTELGTGLGTPDNEAVPSTLAKHHRGQP